MKPVSYAEVDLSAIRANIAAIRARVGPKVGLIAAVKANGYGHGAVEVSRACRAAGVGAYGVAFLEEALELRQAGIEQDIVILGCQPTEAAGEIVETGAIAAVCDAAFARALSDAAVRQGTTARVHVKIDTGMGRIGVAPQEVSDFARDLLALSGLRIEGVFTHFSSSDSPDVEVTRSQIHDFMLAISEIRKLGVSRFVAHASNSGAILSFPEADFDAVRPGIMIYGAYPSKTCPRVIPLREALTLKTQIVFLRRSLTGSSVSYGRTHILKRNSTIATVPIGYADGYSRHLSNAGEAAVRGVRVPVVGRVCMDQTMLDVTDVPNVSLGDEVTLYGGGYDYLSVSNIAEKIGTIPYEVFCAIGKRVARVYTDGADQ